MEALPACPKLCTHVHQALLLHAFGPLLMPPLPPPNPPPPQLYDFRPGRYTFALNSKKKELDLAGCFSGNTLVLSATLQPTSGQYGRTGAPGQLRHAPQLTGVELPLLLCLLGAAGYTVPGAALGAAPLSVLTHAPCSADKWRMDPKHFTVLSPADAAAAFSHPGAGGPFKVVHPSKGDLTSTQLHRLVEKGLQIAEVRRVRA